MTDAGTTGWPTADELRRARVALLHDALGRFTAEELERAGRHPRGMPCTVGDVFRRYLVHDQAHAKQIAFIRRVIDDGGVVDLGDREARS